MYVYGSRCGLLKPTVGLYCNANLSKNIELKIANTYCYNKWTHVNIFYPHLNIQKCKVGGVRKEVARGVTGKH